MGSKTVSGVRLTLQATVKRNAKTKPPATAKVTTYLLNRTKASKFSLKIRVGSLIAQATNIESLERVTLDLGIFMRLVYHIEQRLAQLPYDNSVNKRK